MPRSTPPATSRSRRRRTSTRARSRSASRWRSWARSRARSPAAGLGGGFVGIGLSGAEADTVGSTKAHIEGSVYGDSLLVEADAVNNAHSSAAALAGGLLAVSFNYSHADMSGTVSARLGGAAHVTTDHDTQVLASSINAGHAEGLGVTVGGIAIGGMETSASVGADHN